MNLPLLLSLSALAQDPSGYWKTIDDTTGLPKSIVHVTVDNGVATGKIVQLFRTADQDADPLCVECATEELKKQKINGMTILRDLKDAGEEWSGGTVLDPGNGKTYSVYIDVLEGGEQLKVRGYIGISLLGRTQLWHRVQPPDPNIRSFRLQPDGSAKPLVLADGTVLPE